MTICPYYITNQSDKEDNCLRFSTGFYILLPNMHLIYVTAWSIQNSDAHFESPETNHASFSKHLIKTLGLKLSRIAS